MSILFSKRFNDMPTTLSDGVSKVVVTMFVIVTFALGFLDFCLKLVINFFQVAFFQP